MRKSEQNLFRHGGVKACPRLPFALYFEIGRCYYPPIFGNNSSDS